MAISKKPIIVQNKSNFRNQEKINSIISKGGEVASIKQTLTQKEEKNTKPVKLFIPSDILIGIDDFLEEQPLKKSRSNWLLEAIFEKYKNEINNKNNK